ncbi:class I SAM-dependent methyltransferase [Chloroflexota bacterium]
MSREPSWADFPVYVGDVDQELRLLDELSRFKRTLGKKAVRSGDVAGGAIVLVQGIGFYRCWELPLVVSYFQPAAGTKILDVGSLKSILPLYWALRGCQMSVIDVDPRVEVQRDYARYVGREDLIDNGLHVIVQDATRTDLEDESFDLITNISAVEHFTGDGDVTFVQEAARLLRPGGRLFLSFGIGPEYREWQWEWLFCRTYDERALWDRIIAPSDLEVESVMFFEAEATRRFSERWYRLPLTIRNGLLGWLQKPVYKRLYRREQATALDAYYFGIVLRKPTIG